MGMFRKAIELSHTKCVLTFISATCIKLLFKCSVAYIYINISGQCIVSRVSGMLERQSSIV